MSYLLVSGAGRPHRWAVAGWLNKLHQTRRGRTLRDTQVELEVEDLQRRGLEMLDDLVRTCAEFDMLARVGSDLVVFKGCYAQALDLMAGAQQTGVFHVGARQVQWVSASGDFVGRVEYQRAVDRFRREWRRLAEPTGEVQVEMGGGVEARAAPRPATEPVIERTVSLPARSRRAIRLDDET